MNPEYEAVQAISPGENNGDLKLFEKVFPDPFANESVQPEKQKSSFKPTSVDIEEFAKHGWLGGNFSSSDLQELSQKAGAEGNTRMQQVADFLGNNFEDVSKLSDDGGRISSGDMDLYSQLLKANELGPVLDSPIEAWKNMHYEHQMKQSVLPFTGAALGAYGGYKAQKAVRHTPEVARQFVAFAARNPRTAVVAVVGSSLATYAGSIYAGTKIGDTINRALMSGDINRHFYDEAAPAMKRLIGP